MTVGGPAGAGAAAGREDGCGVCGPGPRVRGGTHTPAQPALVQAAPPSPRKHPHLPSGGSNCCVTLGALWVSLSLTCLIACWTSSDLTELLCMGEGLFWHWRLARSRYSRNSLGEVTVSLGASFLTYKTEVTVSAFQGFWEGKLRTGVQSMAGACLSPSRLPGQHPRGRGRGRPSPGVCVSGPSSDGSFGSEGPGFQSEVYLQSSPFPRGPPFPI